MFLALYAVPVNRRAATAAREATAGTRTAAAQTAAHNDGLVPALAPAMPQQLVKFIAMVGQPHDGEASKLLAGKINHRSRHGSYFGGGHLLPSIEINNEIRVDS